MPYAGIDAAIHGNMALQHTANVTSLLPSYHSILAPHRTGSRSAHSEYSAELSTKGVRWPKQNKAASRSARELRVQLQATRKAEQNESGQC
jgi:hypothetical protein